MRMKRLQEMEDKLINNSTSTSHMVFNDLGDGIIAISF